MPLWWFLIALVFRTATCLFYSRFFCYSWRKKEEKSLFKGQKVSDMWLSTSNLLLQSFFALAARPLWDLTVDMYPHVRIFGLHCPQTSGGGSQPLHCWPDFWACSVESRPAKVGHGDVPSAEKNVSYSTGHIWLVGMLVFPFGRHWQKTWHGWATTAIGCLPAVSSWGFWLWSLLSMRGRFLSRFRTELC